MQTNFSDAQLAEPAVAHSEKILRSCVHCGFCTATCPTYVLLGDELDSPRGRIYLIKDMLEQNATPTKNVVKHIDRCLSCLSCMTTCPSGVNYMHLVDHARAYIEKNYKRSFYDRVFRESLSRLLPRPRIFRLALKAAAVTRRLHGILPQKLRTMAAATPRPLPKAEIFDARRVWPALGNQRMRVTLLAGCVQQSLAPQINAATIRLLTRHGVEVVVGEGAGCCGALQHHLGKEQPALAAARRNIDAWMNEFERGAFDAVVVNASGCGTMLKDYDHLFREDPEYREKAKKIAELARDVTEVLDALDLSFSDAAEPLRVAYHSACSMQHGQSIRQTPKDLLKKAGFSVVEPGEAHLCCGSAGAYSFLQPEIAVKLRERKADHLKRLHPDIVATGNIGCLMHLSPVLPAPIVHTVELLDWASGGPDPRSSVNSISRDRFAGASAP
jgi:glycolate oxidase iron-sulfur subunit